jgi:hypothetical protein
LQPKFSRGIAGDRIIVGHQEYRAPVVVQFLQQVHDILSGFEVEISGWLVGQNEKGAVDQRSSDGDTLLLSA